jgi:hypothetical protein
MNSQKIPETPYVNELANKLETTPRSSLKLGMLGEVSAGLWGGRESDETLCDDEGDDPHETCDRGPSEEYPACSFPY